jgi:hypothetical protein
MLMFCFHYTTEVFDKILLEKTLTIHVRRKYPKGGFAIPEQGVAFHNPHLEKQATETGKIAETLVWDIRVDAKVYPNDKKATVAKKREQPLSSDCSRLHLFYPKINPGTAYPIGSCRTQALR